MQTENVTYIFGEIKEWIRERVKKQKIVTRGFSKGSVLRSFNENHIFHLRSYMFVYSLSKKTSHLSQQHTCIESIRCCAMQTLDKEARNLL